jgi:colicin import membrane protein
MSTVSTTRPPQPPADDPDPYRYGWRYVPIEKPDGTVELDQVPLTLDDVLFPEVGDFIVQSTPHNRDLMYLKSVCDSRLEDDPQAEVLSDCRVDWNLPGVRPLGPDIAVFTGLKDHKLWKTLHVGVEGARPELVVEVTSPDTRVNDVGVKVDFYYSAGVPLYVIADAIRDDLEERRLRLIAYRHAPEGYVKIAPDARGWIWLDAIGVWLGITQDHRYGLSCDRLACYDGVTGEEIGDYTAVVRALEESEVRIAAEIRAREEAQRQAAAEIRAREEAQRQAAAEIRAREEAQRQAAAEVQAREEAQRQAAAEVQAREEAQRQAAADAQARAAAEVKVRELEAIIKRLEQGS